MGNGRDIIQYNCRTEYVCVWLLRTYLVHLGGVERENKSPPLSQTYLLESQQEEITHHCREGGWREDYSQYGV